MGNTLACYNTATITAVKSFIVQAQERKGRRKTQKKIFFCEKVEVDVDRKLTEKSGSVKSRLNSRRNNLTAR